jgi:uncharacterized protein (DUF1786 family)
MRAANATQSAAETPQRLTLISSLLTSNPQGPKFTFAMEVPNSYTRMRLFGTPKRRLDITGCLGGVGRKG